MTLSSEQNPYAASHSGEEQKLNVTSLMVPAVIAIVCCVTSLGFLLLMLIVSLPDRDSGPPLVAVLALHALLMAFPAIGLAGAVSTLQRKNYRVSVAGAIGLLIPVLGPCFGLTFPIGIWLLLLLRQGVVQHVFVTAAENAPAIGDNADDVLAAASQLDKRGDWDAAIALYRSAALRWPEHTGYVEKCIAEIARKQTAAK
jgi:hypothetical protein